MLLTNLRLLSGAALLSLIPGISANTISSELLLHRDIAIIGGGSSGTYAAVQLKRAGFKVALVEKEPRLGGHVNTFKDPQTSQTYDYGVLALLNTSTVRNYFSTLNETLGPYQVFPNTPAYADFKRTGQFLNLPPPDQAAIFAAVQGYITQVSKYPFLTNGYNLPSPVPPDLLLPFGDFLIKYNLQLFAPLAFTTDQGVGNILAVTTLYAFKYLPKATLEALIGLAPPPVTSSSNNNQALYDKAQTYLTPSSSFLNTKVTSIRRVGPSVYVGLSTPTGTKVLIAKRLLIAIQPKLSNLQALNMDLSPADTAIFTQFNNSYYWNAVIKNTGLPPTVAITNIDPLAPMGIAPLPGAYGFTPAPIAGNYTSSWFSSPDFMTDAQVKSQILADVNKIVTANNLASPPPTPEIVGFNNHSPFWLTVPPAKIADGFYTRLNAIQGMSNTWWTGATFVAHDSSTIWEWSEKELLPRLKASFVYQPGRAR